VVGQAVLSGINTPVLWKFKKGLAVRPSQTGDWGTRNLSGFLNLGSLKTNLKEIQSIGNSLRNNNNEGNLYKRLKGFSEKMKPKKKLRHKIAGQQNSLQINL